MNGDGKDNRLTERVEAHIRKQKAHKVCDGCGKPMQYSYVSGSFTCPDCGITQLDNYGRILELLENNPNLTYADVSQRLQIPFRELDTYIQDGVIVNPLLPD